MCFLLSNVNLYILWPIQTELPFCFSARRVISLGLFVCDSFENPIGHSHSMVVVSNIKGGGGQVGKTVKTSDVGFGENCEPQDQKVEGVINGNKRKNQCFFFYSYSRQLTYNPLACRRKPEHLEKTHTFTGRAYKLCTDRTCSQDQMLGE